MKAYKAPQVDTLILKDALLSELTISVEEGDGTITYSPPVRQF